MRPTQVTKTLTNSVSDNSNVCFLNNYCYCLKLTVINLSMWPLSLILLPFDNRPPPPHQKKSGARSTILTELIGQPPAPGPTSCKPDTPREQVNPKKTNTRKISASLTSQLCKQENQEDRLEEPTRTRRDQADLVESLP